MENNEPKVKPSQSINHPRLVKPTAPAPKDTGVQPEVDETVRLPQDYMKKLKALRPPELATPQDLAADAFDFDDKTVSVSAEELIRKKKTVPATAPTPQEEVDPFGEESTCYVKDERLMPPPANAARMGSSSEIRSTVRQARAAMDDDDDDANDANENLPEIEAEQDSNQAVLLFSQNTSRGRRLLLTENVIRIGTGHLNDVQINDPDMNDFQIQVVATDVGHKIQHTQRHEKIIVNGKKTEIHYLKNGDEIQVGHLKITYQACDVKTFRYTVHLLIGVGLMICLGLLLMLFDSSAGKWQEISEDMERIIITVDSQSFAYPIQAIYQINSTGINKYMIQTNYITPEKEIVIPSHPLEAEPVQSLIRELKKFKSSSVSSFWTFVMNGMDYPRKSAVMNGSQYTFAMIKFMPSRNIEYVLQTNSPGTNLWKIQMDSAISNVSSPVFMATLANLLTRCDDLEKKKEIETFARERAKQSKSVN